MAELYVGQIFQGGWNFAPAGSALCAGQLLPISQYQAVFALLGTSFGGNGTSNFQLPDLQGRAMIGAGNGIGLPPYVIGERGGATQVSLTLGNLPQHTHTFTSTSTLQASTTKASTQVPAAGSLLAHADDTSGKGSTPAIFIPAGSSTNAVNLGGLNVAGTIGPTGNSLPVAIQNPYLAITIVISLTGIFPSRN
jgi:microcystin-dependent protein